jgi:hypothetical protein
VNGASHPYKAKGGAPCGVDWAACEFQSCADATRGVRHTSDFEGWPTRRPWVRDNRLRKAPPLAIRRMGHPAKAMTLLTITFPRDPASRELVPS